ncbi:hypothetical protein [Emergencia timonensis]|uniref:hypothetical protein n=2 Tax=Emergencia timonensis TaxID=1776384 RepID=UPI003994A18D
MNLGQSIMTGIVAAVGFFLICFFIIMIFSNYLIVLIIASFFAGLLVTCTSLIIYEIGKVKEEVAKSSSESAGETDGRSAL